MEHKANTELNGTLKRQVSMHKHCSRTQVRLLWPRARSHASEMCAGTITHLEAHLGSSSPTACTVQQACARLEHRDSYCCYCIPVLVCILLLFAPRSDPAPPPDPGIMVAHEMSGCQTIVQGPEQLVVPATLLYNISSTIRGMKRVACKSRNN